MSRAALSVTHKAPRKAKMRDEVFARDRGICAICSKDTEAERRRLEAMRTAAKTPFAYHNLKDELRFLGAKTGQPLYEVDHRTPLSEGGADTIDNCRTLCLRCHRFETKKLAARRARRPKSVRMPVEYYEAQGGFVDVVTSGGRSPACECFGKERFDNARLIAKALNRRRR